MTYVSLCTEIVLRSIKSINQSINSSVISKSMKVAYDTFYVLEELREFQWLNPFTLRAAKRGLTILEIFYLQKRFPESI